MYVINWNQTGRKRS